MTKIPIDSLCLPAAEIYTCENHMGWKNNVFCEYQL